MFTYKFVTRGANKDNLRIRLYLGRAQSELSLGVRISETDLADALTNSPKASNRLISTTLKAIIAKLEGIKFRILSQTLPEFTDINQLKVSVMEAIFPNVSNHMGAVELQMANAPEQEDVGKFIEVYQMYMDKKISTKGTLGVYQHTLSRIRKFDSDIDMRGFSDINVSWLMEFEAFCAKTASKNARNIHLRNIRAIFNYAIDMDITTEYPFRRFKITDEATDKRSLTIEELITLMKANVEPHAEMYRDMFVLMVYLIGINSKDLHGLKRITTGGRIEYVRAKTGKSYSIKVEPEAMAIIDKWRGQKGLLCLADRWSDNANFTHQCNIALQRIGEMKRVGRGGRKVYNPLFPDLSTYWARHTWATLAYELDIPEAIISQAMGHSATNRVTDIYIRRNTKKVDEANRKIIDYIQSKLNE